MKMVEIKSIQQQLFQQQNSVSEKTTRSEGKNVISGENKVNKFKEMFDNEPETVEVERRKPKDRQRDAGKGFDDPNRGIWKGALQSRRDI